MSYQDVTNFTEAMKIFWGKQVIDYQKYHTFLYDEEAIPLGNEHFNGRYFHIPIDIRDGVSVGSRPSAENSGSIPEFYPHTPIHAEVYPKSTYVTMQMTGQVKAQGTGSEEGIWEAVDTKLMRKAAKGLAEQFNRIYWTGSFGILAEVASVAAVAGTQYTVTIKTYGDTILNASGFAPKRSKYLRPLVGRRVVFGAASGGVDFAAATPTGRGVCTVISVGTTSPFTTFVVDVAANPAVVPAAGDVFVLGDATSFGRHSYNQEPAGLQQIVNNANDSFEAVNTTTYPEWAALVRGNPGGIGTGTITPSENDLQELYDNVLLQGNVDKIDCLAMTPGVYRTLVQILRNKGGERYVPTTFKGGLTRLAWTFGGDPVPLYSDMYAPNNDIYYLSFESFMKCTTKQFDWDDTGGSVWKWQAGVDGAVAFGKAYGTLATQRRNGCAKFTDILEQGTMLA